MTGVLVHLLCAATVFLEQEIPGLRFAPASPLTGAYESNFRHVDINKDGFTDLLFNDRVLFQRGGLFPAGSTALLPDQVLGTYGDTFADRLYLRHEAGLTVLAWQDDDWVTVEEHQLEWPDLSPVSASDSLAETPAKDSMIFARYLVDLNRDLNPELVIYARNGVHLYKNSGGKFVEATILDLYPSVTALSTQGSAVWPDHDRHLFPPGQRLDLISMWRDAQITIISRQDDPQLGVVQFRSRSCDLTDLNAASEATIDERSYPLMHESMQPMYLNDDSTLDFAGGAPLAASTSAFVEPLYDTFVSTDEGRTVFRFRDKSYIPQNSFVDIDGDGDIDIVTHSTKIAAGGLRESLNRYFFQRSIGHQISVYLQNDAGGFDFAPRLTTDFVVEFERVPYRDGSLFRRYRAGHLLDVSGDFNADGYKDLVVQESPESLAIFLSRGYRFSKHPIFYLSVQPNERFYVADVDANGLSDVVMIRSGADRGADRSRVYFARQTSP